MILAIGSDHRGFLLKRYLIAVLQDLGHEVADCGCGGTESADYPGPAFTVGELVAAKKVDGGILICGSGIGVSIAANKVRGVRAAPCRDLEEVRLARAHNDINVLCLSGNRTLPGDAIKLIGIFLNNEFSGGRHARRVEMISAYEAQPSEREVP
jgi:ribose 5-phosphate isomerase B